MKKVPTAIIHLRQCVEHIIKIIEMFMVIIIKWMASQFQFCTQFIRNGIFSVNLVL